MNDVTDRLRAANPVKEPPALPPVEPLLARLTDAPPPPRRTHRRLLVPALVITMLVAIVVGSELRGPGVDVVAEARAALGGSGGIVHVVAREERRNPDGTIVEGSGTTSEIWSARDPLRFRVHDDTFEAAYFDGVVTTREDGKLQSTRLDEAGRRATEDIDRNTGLLQPGRDPVPVIQRLLAEGKLEPAGTTDLRGRKAQRLVGSESAPDARSPGVEVEYLVDARTYAPLQLSTKATLSDGRSAGASKLTFLQYERLPRTAANERLLTLK
ncbi:hypothetical protein OJ997_29730 [Solirubrobacter phytolaccae]|uniref:Uncharacterized protein n=1 Tax=Solirubrobacter phytolaccae TaxID=1404360 RepID=A0A9X3SE44_9ACTN|nr:hypothetical protein [Solirubrobacter phytolaccae]MDA0184520.1 hypothetical protein [Solirubrobacter phytolaccae]